MHSVVMVEIYKGEICLVAFDEVFDDIKFLFGVVWKDKEVVDRC